MFLRNYDLLQYLSLHLWSAISRHLYLHLLSVISRHLSLHLWSVVNNDMNDIKLSNNYINNEILIRIFSKVIG